MQEARSRNIGRRKLIASVSASCAAVIAPKWAAAKPTASSQLPGLPTRGPSRVFLSESEYGATGAFFHLGSQTRWRNPGGDWTDASGAAQGEKPFAALADDTVGPTSGDITSLVKAILASGSPVELILRALNNTVWIDGRSSSSAPAISVTYSDGSSDILPCLANVSLDQTTAYQVNASPLQAGPMAVAMRFRSPETGKTIRSAALRLSIARVYRPGLKSTLSVYRLSQPSDTSSIDPTPPLARSDPAIIFQTDWASGNVSDYFVRGPDETNPASYEETGANKSLYPAVSAGKLTGDQGPQARIVDATDAEAIKYGYIPRHPRGKALMLVRGTNLFYIFPTDAKGNLPEEMWSHQSILLGSDFIMPDRDPQGGGKFLGGFAHMTGMAGNGNRATNGLNGWSMRNQFIMVTNPADMAYQMTMMGEYMYTANRFQQEDMWGLGGILERGKWYDIGHHMRMNTPGQPSGLMEVSVNGRKIFSRSDYMWRKLPPYDSTTRGKNSASPNGGSTGISGVCFRTRRNSMSTVS